MNPLREQTEKAAVWIFVIQPLPDWIAEPILWGLEEEGIPADVREVAGGKAESLAKQAADGSPLNVGIGINWSEKTVALSHRDLPAARSLFLLGPADLNPHQLRRLGANAARLVKGEPLALTGESGSTSESQGAAQFPQDVLEKIVAMVVANIPNHKMKGRQDSWKSEASGS